MGRLPDKMAAFRPAAMTTAHFYLDAGTAKRIRRINLQESATRCRIKIWCDKIDRQMGNGIAPDFRPVHQESIPKRFSA